MSVLDDFLTDENVERIRASQTTAAVAVFRPDSLHRTTNSFIGAQVWRVSPRWIGAEQCDLLAYGRPEVFGVLAAMPFARTLRVPGSTTDELRWFLEWAVDFDDPKNAPFIEANQLVRPQPPFAYVQYASFVFTPERPPLVGD